MHRTYIVIRFRGMERENELCIGITVRVSILVS